MRIRLAGPSVAFLALATLGLSLPSLLLHLPFSSSEDPTGQAHPVIVEASDMAAAERLVREVGGNVTHRLASIDAVGARLDAEQCRRLSVLDPSLRIHLDGGVTLAAAAPTEAEGDLDDAHAHGASLVRADRLHSLGIDGRGVTVAVLDTGAWDHDALERDGFGAERLLATYDSRLDRVFRRPRDDNGHGTHVAGVIASSATTDDARYHGVAPNAQLVVIRAFDARGVGTRADVIRGIEWAVTHRDEYDIRVLALAFSAPASGPYWRDPIGRAVMAAWRAGIVVVTSAGNGGPDPMTLGVPANVPYVITVGAMSDARTPTDSSDDHLESYSAAGPSLDAFVKPEVVAPGGHISSLMGSRQWWAKTYPEHHDGEHHFVMSGTSQAMAAVAGVAALVVQADPGLSPDDVKCRLLATARTAVDASGAPAYSIFQQGAGLVDAVAAVESKHVGCANRGLDVAADLADLEHYRGPARRAVDGTWLVEDGTGTWDATLADGGFTFETLGEPMAGFPTIDGTPWTNDPAGGGGGDPDPLRLGTADDRSLGGFDCPDCPDPLDPTDPWGVVPQGTPWTNDPVGGSGGDTSPLRAEGPGDRIVLAPVIGR